ncbi:hypothetical protein Tco_1056708 [Tanacetum coccineum]|uniref:Uncharacterized protein n=1 Tax=Tanacetum coccineum TaxID=301880 RepID=A0ABQ5H3G9_9ASTR
MSKMLYTRSTKLIINYLLLPNKSIPRRLDSKLHSSQDDHPITKLLNTTNGDYKFGMEVLDAMISDVIKKKAGYKYYMAKKVESEKTKIVDELEEQNVSPIKSGRGKGFMCYSDQVANISKLKKVVVPKKTRSLTISEEIVIVGKKLKGPAVEDPEVQLLLDSQKGSKASRLESLRQNNSEESANETDDTNESDKELSNDNPDRDDDASRYGVLMHNKSITTSNSTYLSPTVTSSSLDFIQTLLDETPTNELTDFMSHLVYTNPQTTSVVHNPEGNPELTSYISGNVSRRECSSYTISTSNENSLSNNNSPTKLTTSQSKEADVKGEKKMRNIIFKKEVAQKFKEYDQKLEALTNFNVFEVFEKAIQAKVLTEIKKILPTHLPNVIANYVKPHLNTFVLKVIKINQINLFTQSSTSINDLLDMDLKIKLLNKIHLIKSNDTHNTHQQLYDTLYESITLDQDVLDAQAAQSSFHKRSYDNQDPPNNLEGEIKKERQKDVNEPSSRSSRYYKEGIEDRNPERWSKEVCRYHFEALNAIHHWEEDNIDFFKSGMSAVTKGNIYSDLRIKSVNKLSSENKRLKGREWTGYDVKSSREIMKKIDEVLRYREQLRRLEEYVGGRPKIVVDPTLIDIS